MTRPRIHPPGTTAGQRVAASTAALRAAGGARKTWRLGPQAHAALLQLMDAPGSPATETELIEGLLVAAASKTLAGG